METERNKNETHSATPFEVGLLRPEDAEGFVKAFMSVYGDEYPVKMYYDPKALIEANANGECYTIVARTLDGKIIGGHNLFRSAPYSALYEWGVGLVLPEYRGLGVSGRVGEFLGGELLPQLGVEAAFGEAVCYHLHMQKICVAQGFLETAIEVALMPAEVYSKETSSKARVATILGFRCYRHKLQTVFLPAAYEEELRFLYSPLDDPREFLSSDADFPRESRTTSKMEVFDSAQVARIALHETGADFADHISDLERQARERGVLVFQAWLKLSSPWVGRAVDLLRERGYFFGGLLPRWFDEDGFLMQKLMCDPFFEDMQIYAERSKRILSIVKQDWLRTQQQGDRGTP